MADDIFLKIIAGELPATKIYEDDVVVAFLDIAPVQPGHTLIVPKEHFRTLLETPETILGSMMQTAKHIGSAMKTGLGADGFNIICNNDDAAGQIIFHVHMHVIPRFKNDGLQSFPHTTYANDAEREAVGEKLRTALVHI